VTQEVISQADEKMKKAVVVTGHEFGSVRTGRASGGLIERLQIDYYGTKTPLNQLATITVPEPQMVVLQPWDKGSIPAIEKAILQSDLGLSPTDDGNVIRVPFPALSEERRKDLVKLVKKLAEDGRVAVRNVRRDANETLKSREKEHEISEDDSKRAHDQVQKITDKHIAEIDALLQAKEKEIMEV
jgi:ribosome recycling factor